ncbi:hypothetical protein RRG08_016805 [Elysia crispata]|uniref:Uncharacterized protein n=1 Tax=Elysia crispata TaxID=231223 RepID=A0AAE1A0G4_9GAST|nr:hypothetical protein RRG08_016805 [Elysia crispata]
MISLFGLVRRGSLCDCYSRQRSVSLDWSEEGPCVTVTLDNDQSLCTGEKRVLVRLLLSTMISLSLDWSEEGPCVTVTLDNDQSLWTGEKRVLV